LIDPVSSQERRLVFQVIFEANLANSSQVNVEKDRDSAEIDGTGAITPD
jgi:hypothetical protein